MSSGNTLPVGTLQAVESSVIAFPFTVDKKIEFSFDALVSLIEKIRVESETQKALRVWFLCLLDSIHDWIHICMASIEARLHDVDL